MTAINVIFVVQVVCSITMYFFVKHVDSKEADDELCDSLDLVGRDRVKYTNTMNTLLFTILAIPFVIVLVFSFLFTLAFGGKK